MPRDRVNGTKRRWQKKKERRKEICRSITFHLAGRDSAFPSLSQFSSVKNLAERVEEREGEGVVEERVAVRQSR